MCRYLILALLAAAGVQAEPVPVRTQDLTGLLQAARYSAPATVVALNTPRLSAEISARIERIPVRVGTRVQAGELLVELDCRVHDARLEIAQATLQRIDAQLLFAREQLQRARDLKVKHSISDEVLDQRQSELRATQADRIAQAAQVRLAETDVARCEVRAPFDAVVSARSASVGELAVPGSALLELLQLDELEVSAALDEAELNAAQQASTLHLHYAGRDYALQLRAILPLVDGRSHTRELRLDFVDEAAPSGANGRLQWTGPDNELGADYLVRREGRLGVFLAAAGKARFVAVAGAREGQPARVDPALTGALVTEGRQRLQHGDELQVLEPRDQTQ